MIIGAGRAKDGKRFPTPGRETTKTYPRRRPEKRRTFNESGGEC